MGQWVAAVLSFGLLLAPRFTCFVASIFTIVASADIVQHLYEMFQHWKEDT